MILARVGVPLMLLNLIDDYLRQTKTSPTRFGRDVVGDPNFVLNLRDGRQPRLRTVKRVMQFIEAHDPSAANGATEWLSGATCSCRNIQTSGESSHGSILLLEAVATPTS